MQKKKNLSSILDEIIFYEKNKSLTEISSPLLTFSIKAFHWN